MSAPTRRALEATLALNADEVLSPFGEGWLIHGRRGFKPCPWAFDLARFARPSPGERVLDLGTGVGVLLLALRQIEPALGPCVGVELEPLSAAQAQRNAAQVERVQIVRGDLREAPFAPRAFDLVVMNPPFYPSGWGRQSAERRTAGATHALAGDIVDFCQAARRALTPHGRLVVVYDAGHLTALLLGLTEAGLKTRGLRFLDDDRGKPARVLALAGREGAGVGVDRLPFGGEG